MKITVFNGSIHAKRGNTQLMVDAFAAGAGEAGAQVEMVFLAKKNIRPCTACMSCWTRTPGACPVKDDMEELLPKFIGSDIVVMATPIYVDNVTAILKLFIDRLVPLIDPHMETDENSEVCHRKRFDHYPELVVISSCAFPGLAQFQIINAYFKRVAYHMHARVIAEIYRDAAMMLKLWEKTPMKPFVDNYKTLLAVAGREIVKTRALSEQTVRQISQPFVPQEIYIDEVNKYWDRRIAKAEIRGHDTPLSIS